ncbi:MAG: helix-turn-helix domain-containing protein [Vicinamibacterales bacterium]
MSADSDLWERWAQSKEFRDQYVESHMRQSIPFQVQEMLKAHGMTQAQLAEAGGLNQASVSRAVDPDYGRMTLTSIARIANGFDVAFLGLFVPFSKLEEWTRSLPGQAVAPAKFSQEDRRRRPVKREFVVVSSSNSPRAQGALNFSDPLRAVPNHIVEVEASGSVDSDEVLGTSDDVEVAVGAAS